MAQRINQGAIPDALKNFDTLPDAANVRDKVVAGLFGCSVPTVWRMAKDGRLPRPRKLSERVTAWNVGQLRAALRAAG
ncbi:MAG: AlpA family phage regulatory protein [Sulfuritalea sp.]|nr:AlpA family phage regulatory protein [Sulfuritalea sp.]